jgi:glucosamine 6-phosphate synthetase-like amidotransferase/phosphosugar isomerase protein
MLFLDTFRGEDSTGVFLVDNLGNVAAAKEAVDGPTFLKSQEWRDIRKLAFTAGWALIGHNRRAT